MKINNQNVEFVKYNPRYFTEKNEKELKLAIKEGNKVKVEQIFNSIVENNDIKPDEKWSNSFDLFKYSLTLYSVIFSKLCPNISFFFCHFYSEESSAYLLLIREKK